MIKGLRKFVLFLGDIATLYMALFLMLAIRYPLTDLNFHLRGHFHPFSLLFILWLAVFYLSDFYQQKDRGNNLVLLKRVGGAVLLSGLVSVVVFYLFGEFFKLTPKINLLIFSLVFVALNYLWRLLVAKIFMAGAARILTLGDTPLLSNIESFLVENPRTGYQIAEKIKDLKEVDYESIFKVIQEKRISIVIIQPSFTKDLSSLKKIFQLLPLEVNLINASDFYEMLLEKIPLKELEEGWFIENISTHRPFYDTSKRVADILLSVILGIIFLPFGLLFALAIKLNSSGPAIFKQSRIGKNNKEFTLYKFRVMVMNHSGSPWTEKNDSRFTFVGKILNYTHLNEIPQLWNIFKGDMSFTGPRPESSELVKIYQQLPYYELRHIIKPGVSGWAQINYKPSASLEEAYEKLCYDIYYVKNRSLFLDIVIIFKTIKYIFTSH